MFASFVQAQFLAEPALLRRKVVGNTKVFVQYLTPSMSDTCPAILQGNDKWIDDLDQV